MKPMMKIPIQQRYEIIRNVYNATKSPTKTCDSLNICYNTVQNALNNRNPQPRKYPKKLELVHLNYIHAQTIEDPFITGEELSKNIFAIFSIKVSGRTINRYRHQLNLHYRPPIRSVYLPPTATAKRQQWTNFHISNNTSFKNVVFSDESMFVLGRHKKWVWVDKEQITERVLSQNQHHPPQIMIWGAIGWNFKSSLVFFEESVSADTYIDKIIFGSNFIDEADKHWGIGHWLFQQDNAPAHRAKETIDVLRELEISLLADWPPYSTDLNIIEVVWAIMEARIEILAPKTLEDLKIAIVEIWNALSFVTINGLVASMERRIKAVNAAPNRTIVRLMKENP